MTAPCTPAVPETADSARLAPLFGREAVGSTTLEALVADGGTGEQMMHGCQVVQFLYQDTVSEITASYPDLRADALDLPTAVLESRRGEFVLKVDEEDGQRVYARCPPEYGPRIAELQWIAEALVSSEAYMALIERSSESLNVAAKSGPLTREVREDGAGFRVIDATGEVVAVFLHNIPGKVVDLEPVGHWGGAD